MTEIELARVVADLEASFINEDIEQLRSCVLLLEPNAEHNEVKEILHRARNEEFVILLKIELALRKQALRLTLPAGTPEV
jgi:hypothetical protein